MTTLRSDGSSRICRSAHSSFESVLLLRNRQYVIAEFLKDRSLDLSFSPFIHRRWRKLPMHMKFYSNNMPKTRNYSLLCLRCQQRMLSYTTSKLCHCSAPMVCRKCIRVKPRQIGSCSIFDVSACQRTFCNFNH